MKFRHLKRFKIFESESEVTYTFVSPIHAKKKFNEEKFWMNAYSQRELDAYIRQEELDFEAPDLNYD